jgi:hypothetical protein
MVFGRLRKVWEKIKNGARKVFGFINNKIIPIAKPLAPIIGGAIGGASGAQIGSQIVNGVETGIGTLFPSMRKGDALKKPGIHPLPENRLAPTWMSRV